MTSFFSRRTPRLLILLIFSMAVLAVATLPPASRAVRETDRQSRGKSRRTDFVPGEILVRYRSESEARKKTRVSALRSAEGEEMSIVVERFDGADLLPGLRLARVDTDNTLKAIEALRKQPDVLYAEPNYILHTDATPNDPRFAELFGLSKIGAPLAWDTNTGSASVVVGVIDQGIDLSHEDLNANRFINPSPGAIPGISGDINGWNFRDGNAVLYSGDPDEDHATHVGGIIGAVGNNSTGVVGVNWNVKLMSLKFLDGATGVGDTADAISACNYAKAMRDLFVNSGGTQGANVRVLNNSYGGGGFTNAFLDAINALNDSGILFVAAAGNTQDDPEPNNDVIPHYPSSYNAPNVISVANTMSDDSLNGTLNCGSHFGAKSVHLGAPGTGILSTVPVPSNATGYAAFCGTSMATPHVSGAAALLLAQNPNLTVKQLKDLLLLNGDVIPGGTGLVDKTITGRRLNVGKSFQALAEGDVTPPGAVTSLQVNGQNGRNLDISWTASGDDGSTGQAARYELTFTDSKTGDVIPLRTAVPVASGTSQALNVSLPYRHTTGTIDIKPFDNVGNAGATTSIAVAVPFVAGDPYATTLGVPVALTMGGTRIFGGPNDDDQYSDFLMPQGFIFPFFGTNYTSVKISTNGNLFFGEAPTRPNGEADDVPGSTTNLTLFEMISGLWDDIDLRSSSRSDAGVYVVQPSPNRLIFRWQGVPCNFNGSICTGGPAIDFEIELNTDGTIKSRYGSGAPGNTDLFPVVGISAGEPEPYVIASHTSEDAPISLNNAPEVTYIPRNIINPLDNSFFFVSQQYRDLLGREADLGGLAFWAAEIDACSGNDIECLVNRRTRVSAAFFVENEFQRTGSFVYRSFKGGLGRQPSFAEFNADRPLIVEGPNLEQTKQAYSLLFVQRSECILKYNMATTAEQFVDAVIATIQATSGVDLTGQRASLINTYNTGGDLNSRRALALRAAIDNPAFTEAEYNPSFVLMQYFGYLIRDPDSGGYDFWLEVLNNRDANNFRGMVCSFITSKEYQERFSSLVPHSNQECQLYIRFQ